MGAEPVDGIDSNIESGGGDSSGAGGRDRQIINLTADELYGDVNTVIERVDGRNGGGDDGSDGSTDGFSGSRTKRNTTRSSGRNTATKRGSTPKKSDKDTLKGIESLLLSLHNIAAHTMNAKEMAITPEEATKLTDGISQVAALYEIEVDPRLAAWVYLSGTVASIYGPKVFAYKVRVNIEAQKKAKEVIEKGGLLSEITST